MGGLRLLRNNGKAWSKSDVKLLVDQYPQKGKMWCAFALQRSEPSIRTKAFELGLQIERESDYYKAWQKRNSIPLIGRKRHDHSKLMKQRCKDGECDTWVNSRTPQKIKEQAKDWHSKNPHPKGMKGKKHSLKTKNKLSELHTEIWANKSEDEKSIKTMKMLKTKEKNGTLYQPRDRKTTWKQGWREIGGAKKYYRSRWEANYARYLEFLLSIGAIKSWEHEPKTFWFEDIKRGTRSYLPDFKVTHLNGDIEWHEVKGWMDDKSKTKIKRFAKYYPNEVLVVIQSKQYKKILRDYATEDWE